MKITLVRHGQTEDNFNGILQGRRNVLLNDTGRRESQMLRMKINDKDYDYCYMSPLTRAVETAMILIGDRVEMIPDKRLIERDLGKLDGDKKEMYNEYKFWDYDLNKEDFNVEKIQDVFKRCEEFLDYIKEKYPDKSILIVTHTAPYRALRHLLNKTKLKGNLLDGYIRNCQIEEFEIK